MEQGELISQEYRNTGTTWTNNKKFDTNGYLVVRDIWNSNELFHPLPSERGQFSYWGKKLDQFEKTHDVERQVEGSLSRYSHPQYRKMHTGIKFKLEEVLGRKLYETYYYDRFYFPGQELTKHADRDACEISVSVHVSTNLEGKDADWPFWIKTPDTYTDKKKTQVLVPGENRSLVLKPGDGLLYKGCERPHWRDKMPGFTGKKSKKLFGKTPTQEQYYHQIFFHYVLQDGQRAHCAWDRAR